ncbi:MAG: lipoate--protein ligase [Desulfovibrionaceae bacterium]|nr:lipoate--protein ligase [Desulfovibrionaceae bacterium]
MLFISSLFPSQDCAHNLALEETLLKNNVDTLSLFLLWQNASCVVIGRHQCAAREVNLTYVFEQGIPVVRRISGGGAVYHDLGNLNFSFIVPKKFLPGRSFTPYLTRICAALKELGVDCHLSGRNDLETKGYKISGTSQFFSDTQALCHGTLLVDVDTDRMDKCLRTSPEKLARHGVRSVSRRVANIKDFWFKGTTLDQLKKTLLAHVQATPGPLPQNVCDKADELVAKYRSSAWNYDTIPDAQFFTEHFPWGTLGVQLFRNATSIVRFCFEGDFITKQPLDALEASFNQLPITAYRNLVQSIDWAAYFVGAERGAVTTYLLQLV